MTPGEMSHFVVGVVSELNTQEVGQVRVTFPHLKMTKSDWYRVVTPMGGAGRGMVFMPEVGDHVVVAFVHGDANCGYVLGAVWDKEQKPPPAGGKPAENNVRFIRSRSGHEVRLDDTKGKEKIEIVDKDKARRVVIDCDSKTIKVVSDTGDIEVSAKSGTVTIKASGAVKVDAKTIDLTATDTITISAKKGLKMAGKPINLN
jgi:uncharacterized protein involved in type VI secretion and phage assembly